MIDFLYLSILTVLSIIILYIFINQYFLSKKYYETQRKITQVIVFIFFDFTVIFLRTILDLNIDMFYTLLVFEMIIDFVLMSVIADIFSAMNVIQYPNSLYKRKVLPIITTLVIITISLMLSFLFTRVAMNSTDIVDIFTGLQKCRLIPYILLIGYITLIVPKNKHVFRPIKIAFIIILIGFIFEFLFLNGYSHFEEMYYTIKLIGFSMALNGLYRIRFS